MYKGLQKIFNFWRHDPFNAETSARRKPRVLSKPEDFPPLGEHSCQVTILTLFLQVLRIRIRIHQIHMFLGLQDPDPNPLVRGMDPDPDPALDPDPSIIMQK